MVKMLIKTKFRNLIYRILIKTRRGVGLNIVMTFACNFNCSNCGLKIPNNEYPKEKHRASLDSWKKFIKEFPLKIKDVAISGGEPTLYPDAIEFINWLIDEGYIVSVYTNLSNENLLKFRRSLRLKINATYHKESGKRDAWIERYNRLRKYYKINSYQIEHNDFEFKSDTLNLLQKTDTINHPQKNRIHVGPDLRIFTSCFDKMNYYKKDKRSLFDNE